MLTGKIKNGKQFDNDAWRYYQNYILHREDGPAVEYISGPYKGHKCWVINGKIHRLNGPAVIRFDGSEDWWYNGEQILNCKNQKDFNKRIKLIIRKNNLEVFK